MSTSHPSLKPPYSSMLMWTSFPTPTTAFRCQPISTTSTSSQSRAIRCPRQIPDPHDVEDRKQRDASGGPKGLSHKRRKSYLPPETCGRLARRLGGCSPLGRACGWTWTSLSYASRKAYTASPPAIRTELSGFQSGEYMSLISYNFCRRSGVRIWAPRLYSYAPSLPPLSHIRMYPSPTVKFVYLSPRFCLAGSLDGGNLTDFEQKQNLKATAKPIIRRCRRGRLGINTKA